MTDDHSGVQKALLELYSNAIYHAQITNQICANLLYPYAGEEGGDNRQGLHQGPLPDDQEDATAPEG